MTQIKEIPVLLLTGYLGSGKTTLLNNILNNEKGYRFAVIVNDLGEVNIDAELIQKGGVVGAVEGGEASDLVALSNGCICCTLQTDLIRQLDQLASSGKFDYILIEASGICDPAPIAQTICMIPRMDPGNALKVIPRLDNIVTVVDALRLAAEFNCGKDLEEVRKATDEEKEGNLTALVVDQIEFCNTILLNKISLVDAETAGRLRAIIRAIQPRASIFECDFCNVPLEDILGTGAFDFEQVATSAAWVQGVEGPADEHDEEHQHHNHHHEHDQEHEHGHHEHHQVEDEDEHHHHEHEHGHHHHHDHDHEHGHAQEYGINTFVYYTRKPFNLDRFDYLVGSLWPKEIVRAKGVVYFSNNPDMSYLFEQAGPQKDMRKAGYWCATAPADELEQMMRNDPNLRRDWDAVYGDRMIKLVIIGQNMSRVKVTRLLDNCLDTEASKF